MSKVSILLAVYNGEEYVQSAIESICDQSHDDWELIIVENGSTDSTLEILNQYSKLDNRILVYISKEKNKNKAYNLAFEKSIGDYVCFFAADDLLNPYCIEKRVSSLENNPDINYTTCLLKTFSNDDLYDGLVFPKNVTKPNFSGGSIFFRREIAKLIFPLPEILPNEDVWASLHLKYFCTGSHISETLYLYRIHSHNSYGYKTNFVVKRNGFLKRMNAYKLFYEKYLYILGEKEKKYLKNFCQTNDLAEKNKIFKILISSIKIKDKILFIYYCSPFLFKVKQKFFSLLSGKIELI
jgi:glycosyltransferase involved in cell wall biosynthesis